AHGPGWWARNSNSCAGRECGVWGVARGGKRQFTPRATPHTPHGWGRSCEKRRAAVSRKREGGAGKGRMLYKRGRFLQVVGLLILPVAIAGNLVPDAPVDLRGVLMLSGIGVGVFALGWLLQQAGKRG